METPRRGGIHFGPAALFTLIVATIIAVALFQSRNFGFRAGLFPMGYWHPDSAVGIGAARERCDPAERSAGEWA